DTFTWTVNNPAPVVDAAIADQTNDDGDTVSLDVSGDFSDPDGDSLTFSATGLPTGLSISSAGVISGTLPADASQSGPYTVVVTANDGEGGTVTDTFTWTVNNPAPVVDSAIADQTSDDGDTVSLDVSGNFSDPDGDTLTYSATGLPTGLSISSAGVISGILPADASQSGPYTIVVTANDGEGGTITDTFTWTVNNPAPVANGTLPSASGAPDSAITPIDVSGAFVDPDGDPLNFSATGLPTGLSIDPVTGMISGTVAAAVSPGPFSVTVTADDGQGGSLSRTLAFNIAESASFDVNQLLGDGSDMPDRSGTSSGQRTVGQSGISASGIVTDTVQSIKALNESPVQLAASGAVLQAVEGFDDLGSIAMIEDGQVVAVAGEYGLRDRVGEWLGRNQEEWLPEDLAGFSLSFDVSDLGTGNSGRDLIIIETLVRERFIYIEARSNFAADSIRNVEEFRVTMADGRPVPSWISVDAKGLVMVERPADVELLDLQITAVLSDGGSISRAIEIQATSGEIKAIDLLNQDRAEMFSEQMLTARSIHDGDMGRLAQSLAG
ncbi:MAG TPA: putative Ig domain-containing protein, partial [Afifellaceae bacterium]|nr:putative Ig domain-containing protein [Afifellaceae bacterium]